MESRTIEEKNFVTIQYTIEKSKEQQRKLKNDIVELSKELQQSKLNNVIILGVLIMVLLVGAIMMHFSNTEKMSTSNYKSSKAYGAFQQAQKMDDSLRLAVKKLTQELSNYKKVQYSPLQASLLVPSIPYGVKHVQGKETGMVVDQTKVTEETETAFRTHACLVNKMFQMNGVVFIEANFIEGTKHTNKAETKENIQVLQLHSEMRIHRHNKTSVAFDSKIFQKIMEEKSILSLVVKDRVVYKITEEKLL